MVEVLVFAVFEAEEFVHRVIKVAADTRATNTGGFSFQIKHLTDDAGFPNFLANTRMSNTFPKMKNDKAESTNRRVFIQRSG